MSDPIAAMIHMRSIWRAERAAAQAATVARVMRRAEETSAPAAQSAPATPPKPAANTPIVAVPPTSAELEFERVRREASARIERERQAREAQKAAVATILDAYAAIEPAERSSSRSPRGSDAQEAAAELILSFMPNRRS